MGYLNNFYKIFRGTTAGDKTGTPARTAAQGLNENFDKVDAALEAINNAAEKTANKATNLDAPNHTHYPTTQAVADAIEAIDGQANNYTDTQLVNYQQKSEKGQAGGYVGLNGTNKIDAIHLPSFTDEVIEVDDYASLPPVGAASTIYITIDNNKTYRWGGSVYAEIQAAPGTTDEVVEGAGNKYFTEQRVRDTVLFDLNPAINAVISAGDTIISAFGKLQGQISALKTSLGLKLDKGSYTGTAADLAELANSKETPSGAQSKADAALQAAKDYYDGFTGGGITSVVDETYADLPAMIADQNAQQEDFIYEVMNTGEGEKGYYFYNGTTAGTIEDYTSLTSTEVQELTAAAINAVLGYVPAKTHSEQPLTDTSVLSWDLTANPLAYLLATNAVGNTRTLPNTVINSGQNSGNYQLFFKQDGTGGRTILFEDSFTVFGNFNTEPHGVTVISIVTRGTDSIAVLTAESAEIPVEPETEIIQLGFAVSDENTALTTGNAKLTFRMPYGMNLTEVRANVKTAPTGSTILVDINDGGLTIFSTRVSIDATEKTSTTAATPAVISDATLLDDAEITVDIDQVGSTVAGTGLKIWLIGTKI